MNAYSGDLSFEVPRCERGWKQVLDTGASEVTPADAPQWSGSSRSLKARSLVVLVDQHLC
jgi:hypothetical protein